MRIGRRPSLRRFALVLAIAAWAAPAWAAPPRDTRAEEATAGSPYGSTAPIDDPRLATTSSGEQTVREIGDAVFSRPFHFVRLVAGVAALPVALPIAAVFADWRDAIDMCVTGPWEMVFERPLGE